MHTADPAPIASPAPDDAPTPGDDGAAAPRTGRRATSAVPSADLRLDRDAPLAVVRAGLVPYRTAWDLQRRLVARRQAGEGRDALLLLEHPAVYTLGRRADRANVLWDATDLVRHDVEVVEVDRGGDVTHHGPGQLVGYPILRLSSVRGVVDYVRALEEVLIRALATFGVAAGRDPGRTGVWVGDQTGTASKIAAIGVRVASRGVTSHGFALNVTNDLGLFDGIVPCGIADRGVCSLASLGIEAGVDVVADRVQQAVAEVFAATLEPCHLDDLDPADPAIPGTPEPPSS